VFLQQTLLKNLLAACSTFQTETGNTGGTSAENKAATKLHIHTFQALTDYHSVPRAVIRFSSHSSLDEGQGVWRDRASLFMEIELSRDIPAETSTALATQEAEVLAKFAAIQTEMQTLQGQGEDESGFSYLRVNSMNFLGYDLEAATEAESIDDPSDGDTQKVIWFARWEIGTY